MKDLLISLPSRNILDENPFQLEMSATWIRKIEALKYGAQFQCITVEIKERIKHRIRQSDPPTKPPIDRHSTNFIKEHKSLKVSHLWSYHCQESLVVGLYYGKKGRIYFKTKNVAKGLDY